MKTYSIAFPGQGSQYIGMGKNLYDHNQIAKDVFEEACDILHYDLSKHCFEGDIDELSKMELVQPAILTTGVAAFRVFIQDADIRPSILLGHSLGEITALVCAGVIDFSNALQLVFVRERLMGDKSIEKGIMMAIMGMDVKDLDHICKSISKEHHTVEVSNINSADQIIISGHKEAVEEVVKSVDKLGGRSITINTGNPFHCSMMNPIKERLRRELLKYQYHDFNYPVLSNLDACLYQGKEEVVDRLSEQIVSPVCWKASIDYLVENNITTLIELSPQSVLRNLLMTDDSGIEVYSYDDKFDFDHIKQIKYRLTNDLNRKKANKVEFIEKCVASVVSTRSHRKDERIILIYQKMKDIALQLERDMVEPSFEEMKWVLDSLIEILHLKGVSERECKDRITYILYKTGFFQLFSDYIPENIKGVS
ncbi:MAG: ACP S-malonyltransferase [Clostridiales bacterium]|nr:ACP S-malonyltransferase [Clostridiales bacterium]